MGPQVPSFVTPMAGITPNTPGSHQGVHCYMITIGNNQLVQDLEQVLTDRNFAQAREGSEPSRNQPFIWHPGQ